MRPAVNFQVLKSASMHCKTDVLLSKINALTEIKTLHACVRKMHMLMRRKERCWKICWRLLNNASLTIVFAFDFFIRTNVFIERIWKCKHYSQISICKHWELSRQRKSRYRIPIYNLHPVLFSEFWAIISSITSVLRMCQKRLSERRWIPSLRSIQWQLPLVAWNEDQ